ncbi:MAG: glycosyltransferase [Bacteroidota bacterium]
MTAINRENRWLIDFIKHKPLDAVISDNRFGLYNSHVTTVFITHQLQIKTSLGRFADALVRIINYSFINRFNDCWVPDLEGRENLGGELSHPIKKPLTGIRYTGLLSAVKKQAVPVTNKLLVLLSGPEPQRSILEELLLRQLSTYAYPAVLVRGLPMATGIIPSAGLLTVHNYLFGSALEQVINESALIICRSGYSTLMDLMPLGKKCILIPTPGQAEQEYLAAYLADKNYVCAAVQKDFNLSLLTEQTAGLLPPGLQFVGDDGLEGAIMSLLAALNKTPVSGQ